MVCRVGKADLATTQLAFWPRMDDSVWTDGRGGLESLASAWFEAENNGPKPFRYSIGSNFPWTPAFFALHLIRASVWDYCLLLLCLLFFIVNARKVDRLAAALFVPYVFWICFAGALNYTIWSMNSVHASERPALPTAYALRLNEPLGAEALPSPASWEKAPAIQFDQDWKGENADPQRATEVRLLWTPDILYLRFHCNYRNIFVFPDARADGWRYELWDRDVAETFLQPDSTDHLCIANSK